MTPLMLRSGQIIQLLVIAMLAFGVVMVHSAAMSVGGDSLFSWRPLLTSRYTLHAVAAVAAMLLAGRLDLRQLQRARAWRNPMWWLLAAGLVLMILAVTPWVGKEAHGASRWITIGSEEGGISFQPSEMMKWLMVPIIAWWCWKCQLRGTMGRFVRGLCPALLLIGGVCYLIVDEDLGTGVLVGAVAMLMLLAGGARVWQLLLLLPPVVVFVALAIWQDPYRLQRLITFVNPWADPLDTGYQPIQSMLALAEGGLTGQGLGNGIMKFGYLPTDTSDFVFAVICEELGLAGAAAVAAMIIAVIWTGVTIIRQSRDAFMRLVALGIVMTFALQGIFNIAVVTVSVPTKGIALPLISAGGTGLILTAFSLGLLAAMDQINRLEADEEFVAEAQPQAPQTMTG